MIKHVVSQILKLFAHGLTFVVAVCITFAATWDGVRPCTPCANCYHCGDILHQSCAAWVAWEESWNLDWWPLIWMGVSALVVMLLPWTWHPTSRTLGLCLHAINLLWLLFLTVPFSWRQKADVDRCHKAYPLAYIGSATGRMCGINMSLLLISIGRSSAWLQKFNTSYVEAISIHRIAGWWCVAHAVLHTLAFLIYYWFEGGWLRVFQHLVPVNTGATPNFSGMMNFYGALSVIGSLVLALFATPCIRRRMYGIFYSTHLISSMVFIFFGILHDFGILLYTLPACSYIIERVHARYGRSTCRAQVELLSPTLLKLSVSSRSQPVLVPGTRWLYIKIPCISREWHPYSITGTADSVFMHIKAAGDWTQSLCSYAQRLNEIDLLVDGPYGMADGPWTLCKNICGGRCLSSDLALRSLLLIAGGVGIVPFADLLDGQLVMWSTVTIVWAVRSESEFEVLEHSLCMRLKTSGRVQIHVYITQPTRDAPCRLESELPASQMQSNQNRPSLWLSFGLALKSQLVTGLSPGLVLFFTIKVYDSILTWADKQSWRNNPFKERIYIHGSIFIFAYAMVGLSAVFLALLVYGFRAAATRTRSCLPGNIQLRQDDHCASPLQDGQVIPCASRQFLIKEGRPDISAIVSEVAQETTTLSLHACGPSSLLNAVRVAVSKAHTNGRKVTLQIEQSEW